MAACLITLGGTNGTIRIDYTLASTPNYIISNFGDAVYIDDTATDITYTTLTGDVTASSGCVTITDNPKSCYLISYDRPNITSTYQTLFDAIEVGTPQVFTTASQDSYAAFGTLIYNINTDLDDDNIKVVAYRMQNLINDYNNISLLVRIIGTDVPLLRIISPAGNYTYIKGIVQTDCAIPADFTAIEVCDIPPAP